MKKFKFQLETLLRVTRRKQEEAEIAFGAATRDLEEKREHKKVLLQEMQQGHVDYEKLVNAGKIVTVGRLAAFTRFFAWKRDQIEKQDRLILEAVGEKQKRLKELMEVMTYLKSIEQLKQKRFKEYRDEALHEEQKTLDEIGLQLTVRHQELNAG